MVHVNRESFVIYGSEVKNEVLAFQHCLVMPVLTLDN